MKIKILFLFGLIFPTHLILADTFTSERLECRNALEELRNNMRTCESSWNKELPYGTEVNNWNEMRLRYIFRQDSQLGDPEYGYKLEGNVFAFPVKREILFLSESKAPLSKVSLDSSKAIFGGLSPKGANPLDPTANHSFIKTTIPGGGDYEIVAEWKQNQLEVVKDLKGFSDQQIPRKGLSLNVMNTNVTDSDAAKNVVDKSIEKLTKGLGDVLAETIKDNNRYSKTLKCLKEHIPPQSEQSISVCSRMSNKPKQQSRYITDILNNLSTLIPKTKSGLTNTESSATSK